MRRTIQSASIIAALLIAGTATAQSTRQAQRPAARPTATSAPRAPQARPVVRAPSPAARRAFLIDPNTSKARQEAGPAVAKDRLARLTRDAKEGYAAFQELVVYNARSVTTVREGEYDDGSHGGSHKDTAQVVEVSGVPGGALELTHLGTLSTHDLYDQQGNFDEKTYKARLDGDGMRVSYDYGPGTTPTVLVTVPRSGQVSKNDIKVPLKAGGTTRIIYERMAGVDAQGRGGYVVGGTGGYTMGRQVEIKWDGSQQ